MINARQIAFKVKFALIGKVSKSWIPDEKIAKIIESCKPVVPKMCDIENEIFKNVI